MSVPAPTPGLARDIDEVIAQLDDIIARSIRDGSRLGYFAALYRKVTAKVKEGIAQGRFEDGPRMERLDVTFANRYLEAMDQFRRGKQNHSVLARVLQSRGGLETNHSSGSASGNERAHQLRPGYCCRDNLPGR